MTQYYNNGNNPSKSTNLMQNTGHRTLPDNLAYQLAPLGDITSWQHCSAPSLFLSSMIVTCLLRSVFAG